MTELPDKSNVVEPPADSARIVLTASGKVQIDSLNAGSENRRAFFELEQLGEKILIRSYGDAPLEQVVELSNWQAKWLSGWLRINTEAHPQRRRSPRAE